MAKRSTARGIVQHYANATMHNILREYFGKFSPVAPKVEGRITATDAPQDVLSQLEGYDHELR